MSYLHTPPDPVPPAKRPFLRRRSTAILAFPVVAAVAATIAVTAASAGSGAPFPAGARVVEAESFSADAGARLESTGDAGGGKNVGWLANGDWMRYDGVDLGGPGTVTATVRVAAATDDGGTVELRTGAPDGPLLASYTVTRTGGWQKWTSLSATGASQGGSQSVFLLLKANHRWDFVNVNWIAFGRAGSPTTGPTTGNPPTAGPTASPTPPAPPTTAPTTPTKPPTGAPGWVTLDQAAWAAQLEKFFAMTPKKPRTNPVKVPEFHASCKISHHADDDPIVFPGLPGASHNHTFWGNTSTNASTTPESLFANKNTTCKPAQDLSAYWIPTLYQRGKPVDPKEVTVYYGSRLKDPTKTVPFPTGFRMIVGDAKNQVDTPDKQGNHFWCAGIGGATGRTPDGEYPVCAKTAELIRQITFPDCWDGVHLDSPDHKSHVGPADSKGVCSGRFPVAIPSVSFVIPYPLNTDTTGITLASGNGFSMHADFFSAWEPQALAERVRNCVHQSLKCDANGNF